MKILFKLLPAVLFISLQTFASDTTSCPTMHSQNQEISTVFGNNLQIQALNAAAPTCAYAKDAKVTITYSWFQDTTTAPRVEFWTKINNTGITLDLTVVAMVSCNEIFPSPYFSTDKRFKCTAKAFIGTGYQDKMNVEVAPLVDGQWDTRGYSQNYYFQF